MRSIFSPEVQIEVLSRIAKLTPYTERRWGSMSAPQMVDHLNVAFEAYMGRLGMHFIGRPLWARISKLLTFTPLPIPHGFVKIPREYESRADYDLDEERQRFASLLAEFCDHEASGDWPEHIFLGRLTAEEYGKLTYKHIHHHLKQFGV